MEKQRATSVPKHRRTRAEGTPPTRDTLGDLSVALLVTAFGLTALAGAVITLGPLTLAGVAIATLVQRVLGLISGVAGRVGEPTQRLTRRPERPSARAEAPLRHASAGSNR